MTFLAAFLVAALQDRPPAPPEPPRADRQEGERRRPPVPPDARPPVPPERLEQVQREIAELEERAARLRAEQPQDGEKVRQLRQIEGEIRRLRGALEGGRAAGPAPDRSRIDEELRTYLQEYEPEILRRLQRGQRPDEMARTLEEARGRMREMKELKEHNPEAYARLARVRELERQTGDLAEQARRAPAERREQLVGQLNEQLGKLFDLREENRASELAELKRRVEELEKATSARKANKERIVERRRKQLLGELGNEDW